MLSLFVRSAQLQNVLRPWHWAEEGLSHWFKVALLAVV